MPRTQPPSPLDRIRAGFPVILDHLRNASVVAKEINEVLDRVVRLADPPAKPRDPVVFEKDPVTGVYRKK